MNESVILKAAKSDHTFRLRYLERELAARQARLAGRIKLVPDIDLDSYECRAVIDWIDVGMWLRRQTQAIWVHRAIELAIGQKCLVEDQSYPGEEGTTVRIRFQDPSFKTIVTAVSAIDKKFGILIPSYIIALEVSVDFRPKEPSIAARARMHGVLARHFLPGRNVMKRNKDGHVPGDGVRAPTFGEGPRLIRRPLRAT